MNFNSKWANLRVLTEFQDHVEYITHTPSKCILQLFDHLEWTGVLQLWERRGKGLQLINVTLGWILIPLIWCLKLKSPDFWDSEFPLEDWDPSFRNTDLNQTPVKTGTPF